MTGEFLAVLAGVKGATCAFGGRALRPTRRGKAQKPASYAEGKEASRHPGPHVGAGVPGPFAGCRRDLRHPSGGMAGAGREGVTGRAHQPVISSLVSPGML